MERLLPRWFVRWLDSDIPYLISGGGWGGFGQLFGTLASLATAYVFAHFLPQDAYGTYKYVLSVAALLAIPALSGMNSSVLQAVAQGADGTPAVAIRRRFLFGLLGTAAGVILGGYYFAKGNSLLGFAFLIAAAATPIMESLSTGQTILLGKRLFATASRQTILTSLITASAVIAAVVLTANPLWIVAAYFAGTTAGRFITYLVGRRFIANAQVSNENLRFGMHISIASLLGIVGQNADVFLLWHTSTPQTLALYAFALATVTPFQSLVKTVLNLAQQKFATQTAAQLSLTVPRRARQTFFVLLPLVLAAVVALPYLYRLLFPNYVGSILFAQILVLPTVVYSEKLFSVALLTMRESRALYALNMTNALLQILFLATLIPLYGGWGAVVAALLQSATSILITRYFFYRQVRLAREATAPS